MRFPLRAPTIRRLPTVLAILTALLLLAASAHAQDDGPPPSEAMPPGPDDRPAMSEAEAAALNTVDAFGRMWEDEDMDTFERIIAHDDDMVVIGTDSAEYVVGYEAFKKTRQEQFDAFENVEFYVRDQDLKLSDSGSVAWFSEQFDLFTVDENGPVTLNNARLSGVMEKRDGQWKIVHLHTSVPVAGQAADY